MKTISLVFICISFYLRVSGSSAEIHESPRYFLLDTLSPYDYVLEFNNKITDEVLLNSFGELKREMEIRTAGCRQFTDTVSCFAGMYFTGGYMFQQAMYLDPSKFPEFRDSAEIYYERALTFNQEDPLTWSNLSLMLESHELNEATVSKCLELAEKYPTQRTDYLIRIGDLYLKNQQPKEACTYFAKAYKNNPSSEQACQRLVAMYQVNGLFCAEGVSATESRPNPAWDFAYQCIDAGFANYAEEIIRQQIVNSIDEQKWKYANLGIILWTNLLAKQKWLDPERVEDLRFKVVQKGIQSEEQHLSDSILLELVQLIKATRPKEMKFNGFWARNTLSPMSEEGYRITPSSVFVRILHARGEESLFRGKYDLAKDFWNRGRDLVDNQDPMCLKIARDLIELYEAHPELDAGGENTQRVISRLFEGKMEAIYANNQEVRRKFHALLGSIYYKQKKDTGGFFENSVYQLEHAIEGKGGEYVVEPEVRKMLADVYERNKRPKEALAMRVQTMKDLLIQDRIKAAFHMGKEAREFQRKAGLPEDKSIGALEKIAAFRTKLSTADSASVTSQQLADILTLEKSIEYPDEDFVQLQVFKMISDVGEKMVSKNIQEKQKVFAQALPYLGEKGNLSSYSDFRRLQNIKTSLEKSVDHPMLILPVVYKSNSYNSGKAEAREGYKVFKSSQTGQEIQIPITLFDLSTKVKAHYESAGEVKEIPQYEFKASVLQVKALNSQNFKANVQENQKLRGKEKVNEKESAKTNFQGGQMEKNTVKPKLNFKGSQ